MPNKYFLTIILGFFILLYPHQLNAIVQSFAIIGDAGRITSNSNSVKNSIRRAEVQNLILPGDNLYGGSYETVWRGWDYFDFGVVAIGNHNGGYRNEIDYFDMPGEFYSKEYEGGIRFLVLNSDNLNNVANQIKWLENELQKDATVTFLVWHHPSYTFGDHTWTDKKQFQIAARKLIHRYSDKISAVLVGHDHIAALYCSDEVPFIVSGAVQETTPPRTRNYKAEDGTMISTKWSYPNTPTWARLDINTEKQLVKISFIKASNDAVMFKTKFREAPKRNICLGSSGYVNDLYH